MPKSRQTVRDYVEEWLAAIAPTVRPSTHYSYGRNLRLHVVPRIGSAPVAAVDAGTLNQLYAALLANGRKDHAGGGLSPRSVRYIHTIIHRALKDAVRWGRLARNPADAADPPKAGEAGRPESITWTATQLRAFLEGTRSSRHWTAYLLLATTGMRRGEVLGCGGVTWTSTPPAPRSDKPSSLSSTLRCSAHRRLPRGGVRSPSTPALSWRFASTANNRRPSGY